MNFDFKNIINTIPSPLLIAQPVYKDTGSNITDFNIVFQNDAFKKSAGFAIEDNSLFSEFRQNISTDVPWFALAETSVRTGTCQEKTFYSQHNKLWYQVQMNTTSEKMLIVTLTDITNDKKHAQQLREIAYLDTLTGLPNRNSFSYALQIAIDTSKYAGRKFGLLLIDIDNMKNINDANGHQAGDALLRQAAQILKEFARDSIQLFRFGDDEFLVIISNAESEDSITNVTDAIYEAFAAANISVSGGIAVFPDDSEQDDELLRFADMAVHHAKKSGKNRFDAFEPDMQRLFISRLTLQRRLTAAILSSDFEQFYQPQFNIKTGKLRGFEALLRWHDSELGNVPPSLFIPVAEETGLILPIGKWVMKTALVMLKRWQTLYDYEGIMSINVSPMQLKQESFIPELNDLIAENNLDPSTIEIEITEGVMIENMNAAIESLNALKKKGIRISLDDFGTGYSSLNYLQMLPLNTLKIDKSFINNITASDGVQANITNSIISMVTNMGLDTIAEGVEKPNQLILLDKFNCHIVQGFLRGKPMPQEKCEQYLSGNEGALVTINSQPAEDSDSR